MSEALKEAYLVMVANEMRHGKTLFQAERDVGELFIRVIGFAP